MNEEPKTREEDEDQPLLPLDERFRQADQYNLDLFPDDEEEKEKQGWRRYLRLLSK